MRLTFSSSMRNDALTLLTGEDEAWGAGDLSSNLSRGVETVGGLEGGGEECCGCSISTIERRHWQRTFVFVPQVVRDAILAIRISRFALRISAHGNGAHNLKKPIKPIEVGLGRGLGIACEDG